MAETKQAAFKPGELRYREYFKISKGDDSLGWRKYFYFRVYHPMFPTVFFGLITLGLISVARAHFGYSLLSTGLLLLGGLFLWSLAEYFIHRFLFHWDLPPKLQKNFPDLHPAHHRDTKDRSLIIAPQSFALMVSSLFFLVLWALTQSWGLALILLSGILWGYVLYEWSHYGTHEYRWRKGFLSHLKLNHLYHHFKNSEEAFGVSSTVWDGVFGTPMKNQKSHPAT